MQPVELDPSNLLAWELYHQARLEGIGPLILELRILELDEYEAEELAYKLDVLGTEYAKIEAQEIRRARDEAETKRRMSGR